MRRYKLIAICTITLFVLLRVLSVKAAEKDEGVKISLQASEESQAYIQKRQEEAAKRHKQEIERLQKSLKEAQGRVQKWEGPIGEGYETSPVQELAPENITVDSQAEGIVQVEEEGVQAREQTVQQELTRLEEERNLAKEKKHFEEEQRKFAVERKRLEEQKRRESLKRQKEDKLRIEALYKKGKEFSHKDQFEKAIVYFNEVILLDPGHEGANSYLTEKIPARQAQINKRRHKEQELIRQQEEQRRKEQERKRKEEERKLAKEERRLKEQKRKEELVRQKEEKRLEEQKRKEALKRQKEDKRKIDSLYIQARKLFYADELKEAQGLFYQILAIDSHNALAKDYIDSKIPGREKQIAIEKEREERRRVKEEQERKRRGEKQARKEEKARFAEEGRRHDEQRHQEELKIKRKIDSLYSQARKLFYADELKGAQGLFYQILAIDPHNVLAKDYIDSK
ncbi:MAG: hypothetical protein HQ547_00040, partial [Candidatus Omnitrophica bacterium]|nr:hypothetical protein [Candidatus Omnitrophota bacterium]